MRFYLKQARYTCKCCLPFPPPWVRRTRSTPKASHQTNLLLRPSSGQPFGRSTTHGWHWGVGGARTIGCFLWVFALLSQCRISLSITPTLSLDAFDVANYCKFGNRCSCRRTCGGHCHHHPPSLVTFRRWFPFAEEQMGAQAEFRHLQNLKLSKQALFFRQVAPPPFTRKSSAFFCLQN